MQASNNHYEVTVRQRVPYLTVFFSRVFTFFAICSLLVYLIMYPVKNAPGEITAVYFNLLPAVIQKFIAFSTAGLLISGILYLKVRLYKKAVVTFEPNQINIIGKSINLKIETYKIRKVTFMDDSQELGGQLKEKLMVYFQQKQEKSVRLRLIHYVQAEDFMNEFLRYTYLDYEFLNIEFDLDLANEI